MPFIYIVRFRLYSFLLFVFFSCHLPRFHLLCMVLFLRMWVRLVTPECFFCKFKVNAEVTQSHLGYSVVFHSAVRTLILYPHAEMLSVPSTLLGFLFISYPHYSCYSLFRQIQTTWQRNHNGLTTRKIERRDSCVKCRKAWIWYSSATARASRYKIQEPPTRSSTVKSVLQTEGSNAVPATQLGIFAAAHGKIHIFQCSITNLKSTVKLFLCICLGYCCNWKPQNG